MVVQVYGDVAAASSTATARRVVFGYDLIAYIESVAVDGAWIVAGASVCTWIR